MASTAKGKLGATASTCSLVRGRREYGGGIPRGCWQEAMLLFSQWGKGERRGFGGHGLVSSSLDQGPFYLIRGDDVDGIPLPDPRRARFLRAPTCCLMMDSPSI